MMSKVNAADAKAAYQALMDFQGCGQGVPALSLLLFLLNMRDMRRMISYTF